MVTGWGKRGNEASGWTSTYFFVCLISKRAYISNLSLIKRKLTEKLPFFLLGWGRGELKPPDGAETNFSVNYMYIGTHMQRIKWISQKMRSGAKKEHSSFSGVILVPPLTVWLTYKPILKVLSHVKIAKSLFNKELPPELPRATGPRQGARKSPIIFKKWLYPRLTF